MDVEPISDGLPEKSFVNFLGVQALYYQLTLFLIVESVSNELHENIETVSVEDVN